MVTAVVIFEHNFLEGKDSVEACVMLTENH